MCQVHEGVERSGVRSGSKYHGRNGQGFLGH